MQLYFYCDQALVDVPSKSFAKPRLDKVLNSLPFLLQKQLLQTLDTLSKCGHSCICKGAIKVGFKTDLDIHTPESSQSIGRRDVPNILLDALGAKSLSSIKEFLEGRFQNRPLCRGIPKGWHGRFLNQPSLQFSLHSNFYFFNQAQVDMPSRSVLEPTLTSLLHDPRASLP